MRRTSGKFTPLAFTETKSCPLPGAGDGTSSTTSESGGPQFLHSTAFMRALSRSCRHHSRPVASATIVGLPCIAPEGGFHGRRHHRQARATIRGFLDAGFRLDHRYPDPRRRYRSDCGWRLRHAIRAALLPGENRDVRFARARAAPCAGGDRLLALPRRDPREDADLGQDSGCGDARDAFHGKADRSLLRVYRFLHLHARIHLDRFRQAQAGLARQAGRDGGDLRRGRLSPVAIGTGTRKGEDMSWGFWIVVGIVVAAVVWLISIYNGLVAQRNRFKNAFAQIDVQLKRRYDLIPNLVETAKGYIKHERGTLEAVIAARNAASTANVRAAQSPGDATAMKELSGAEAALSGTLGRLFALSEAYPDLKANTTMMSLMEELTSTENKVAFARQAYNDAVMAYNTQRETFPTNLIAAPFNFGPAELFVLEKPEEKEAPKVSFS